MPQIIKLARGLRALLGGQGDNYSPQDISAVLAPTVDLTQPYLLDNREYVGLGSVAAPVVGANLFPSATSFQPVPAGELWYVWGFVAQSQPGAGAAIDFAAAIQIDGNPITLPVGDYIATAALQDGRSSTKVPFWAGPSTFFGFVTRSVTLAPAVFGALVATRLRI